MEDDPLVKQYRSKSEFSPQLDESLLQTFKQQIERQYEEKLAYAKAKYDERLETLSNYTRKFYEEVRTDEALNAMRNDEASQGFVNARITEIYDDSLAQEREMTIERLNSELVTLKGEFLSYDQEVARLRLVMSRQNDAIHREEAKAELKARELHESSTRYSQSSAKLEADLAAKELELRAQTEESMIDINSLGLELRKATEHNESLTIKFQDKEKEISDLKSELMISKNENKHFEEIQLKYKLEIDQFANTITATKKDIKELEYDNGEMRQMINNLNDELEFQNQVNNQLQQEKENAMTLQQSIGQQFKDALDEEKRKSTQAATNMDVANQSKKRQFKKKIIEQKAMIDNLITVVKSREAAMDEQARNAQRDAESLKEEINRVKEDYALKCMEIEHESNRKMQEAQGNHKVSIADMQIQYQEMAENRIRDIQTANAEQLSLAKDAELELRSKLQDTLQQMELNYVPKTQHEETLGNLQSEHYDIVQKLKHEIGAHVENARQAAVDHLKTKNDSDRAYKDLQSKLEETSMKHKSQLQIHQMEAEKEKTSLSEFAEKIQRNVHKHKQKKAIERQWKFKFEKDLADNMKKNEDLFSQVEGHRAENATNINSYEEKIQEQARESEKKLKKQLKRADTLQQELSNVTVQASGSQQENIELRNNITQLKDELTNVFKSSQVSTEEIRRDIADKMDREQNSHQETKSQLMNAEQQINSLRNELSSSEARKDDYKRRLTDSELRVTNSSNRIHELQTRNSDLDAEVRDLVQKYSGHRQQSFDQKNKLQRLLRLKLDQARSELTLMKNHYSNDYNNLQAEMENMMKEIIFKYEDHIKLQTVKYDQLLEDTEKSLGKEFSTRLDQTETELNSSYQIKLDHQKQLLDALEIGKSSMQEELVSLKALMESKEDSISIEKKKNDLLRNENENLVNQLQQNSEAFDKLQGDVAEEAIKIKMQQDHMLQSNVDLIQRRYCGEVEKLQIAVESLQAHHTRELEHTEADILKLCKQHRNEIASLRTKYEKVLDQTRNELFSETCKSSRLQEGLQSLDSKTTVLQRDQEENLKKYEIKLEQLQEGMNKELDKHIQFKIQKNSNISELTSRLREVTSELSQKSEYINNMELEKGLQRNSLRDLEMQLKTKDSQMQRELGSTLASKELEISELRRLMSDAYTESIGQAKNLDLETRELRQRARQSPDKQGPVPPLSMSQLRSSS